MNDLHTPLALKLHAHGLQRLFDPNWKGLDLYYLIKGPIRSGIMHTTQKEGLLFHLGTWFYGEYVLEEGDGASGPVLPIKGEYCLWYIEDLIDFLLHHGVSSGDKLVREFRSYVGEIAGWYESDEAKYFDFVRSRWGKRQLMSRASLLREKFEGLLQDLAPKYAQDYAERVFHDRELCAYISELILSIGHAPQDEESEEFLQWVERKSFPTWAQRAVIARDRGSCGECGANITSELTETPHVDHIIPLARGGTNDLVNLQLLCSKCNLKKGAKLKCVRRSMPAYLQRK